MDKIFQINGVNSLTIDFSEFFIYLLFFSDAAIALSYRLSKERISREKRMG
jgi:hypothetical protein